MKNQPTYYLFLLFLLGGLLSACSGPTERLWLHAPGWKRALMIGTTAIADPVPVVTDDQGALYFFVMEGEEVRHPQVISLDRDTEQRWVQTLETPVTLPDEPNLVWAQDQLHLFWMGSGSLYTAALDRTGEVVQPPTLLSGEHVVQDYAVDVTADGEVVLWYSGSRRKAGLWALGPGLAEPAVLVDELGVRPVVRYDSEGRLHVVWAQYEQGQSEVRLYYALYPEGEYDAGIEPVLLSSLRIGLTSIFSGPYLGLTEETTYLFWALEITTGVEAGSARTEYLTFPTGRPEELSEVQSIGVPSEFNLEYLPVAGTELVAGPRVPLPGGFVGPSELAPNPGLTESEMVVAGRASVEYRLRKTAAQASLVYLRDGQPVGYQLLSFTRIPSGSPYVTSDETGALYSTWIETGAEGGFYVYFASTAEDLLDALGEVNAQDVGNIVAETAFGMLTGAILAPFAAFLWLILPLIVMGLSTVIRRESNRVISVGTALSLGLAIAAFWLVKLGTLTGASEYVPFSAWIPFLPVWLGPVLRWGVSLLILALGFGTAWYFTFRRGTQSALYFLLIYAAVDSVLTLSVYGVIIYGFI